jgi:3-hydroxyisobutyrate dehydrogenase-like beta-hydroxyacid dehydrogenase
MAEEPMGGRSISKVAFIGLGVMGSPMAGHLARSGLDVTVYNRTASKAGAWVSRHGGRAAATPREAAQGADMVLSCVGNDNDLRSVTLGPDGAFAGMEAGAIFADHSTVSADLARELYESARAGGFHFLDAPVSGGQSGAENGALSVMVGGDTDIFEKASPVMERYARAVTHMGGPGAGQLTKMVNQIAIAGLVQALAEAMNFALKSGLDTDRVIGVISKGAAGSWQLDNRAATMVEGRFDFGFAVDWMRKDLQICLDEARRNGAALPVTALVEQLYGRLQEKGSGRLDSSSLMKLLVE